MYEKKKRSAELKQLAREALVGRYGVMAGATALLTALNFLAILIPLWIFPGTSVFSQICQFAVSIATSLLISLFGAGMAYLALDVTRGQKPPFGNMLYPFFHHPDRFLIMSLVLVAIQSVLQIPVYVLDDLYSSTFLTHNYGLEEAIGYLYFSLLCSSISTLIYTIIALRFAMASYLLIEYEDLSGIQALKESARMMKGHKARYFYVSISFFGMLLLGSVTCGIGMLWITPYMETTFAYFYRDLKNEI